MFLKDKIKFIKQGVDDKSITIRHYIYDNDNYDINIICCELKNKDSLEKNWIKIIENIAMYIQMELNEDIEYYNVYTIFFSEDVPQSLINLIEHDTYSSRKMVINDKMPISDSELSRLVNERLFTINLKIDEESNISINDDIDIETLETLNIINDEKYTIKEKLERILKETL